MICNDNRYEANNDDIQFIQNLNSVAVKKNCLKID